MITQVVVMDGYGTGLRFTKDTETECEPTGYPVQVEVVVDREPGGLTQLREMTVSLEELQRAVAILGT